MLSLIIIAVFYAFLILLAYLSGCFHYSTTRTTEVSKSMVGHENEIIRRTYDFRKGFVAFLLGEFVQIRCVVCGKRHD